MGGKDGAQPIQGDSFSQWGVELNVRAQRLKISRCIGVSKDAVFGSEESDRRRV